MRFFQDFIDGLLQDGHQVDIACNDADYPLPAFYLERDCRFFKLSCSRSPVKIANLQAIRQIKKIVSENRYDIIHCHTPIAAACTRIACIGARKKGTKVFYTAHGFHFYTGAPAKNWLLFYPIERLCSRWTDNLITINTEDFQRAKGFRAKQVTYVPGVGVSLAHFSPENADSGSKKTVLRELGIPEDARLLLSVGELNRNKNHETVIRALAKIDDSRLHYAIAGVGGLDTYLVQLAQELGVSERVHLLGYRRDIELLHRAVDVFILPSFREGLSVATIEALASGLPCVVSDIRGNRDLVDKQGGRLANPADPDAFAAAIGEMLNGDREKIREYNRTKAAGFSIEIINGKMRELYGL